MKKYLLMGIGIVALIIVSIYLVNFQTEKNASEQKVSVSGKNGTESNGKQGNSEQTSNQLKEKYRNEFQQINFGADKRVDSLIEKARNEFHLKQEQKADLTPLKAKYQAIFDNYEEKTKQQFDSATKRLEKETIEHKQPMTITQEFTEAYQLKKADRFTKWKTELEKISLIGQK